MNRLFIVILLLIPSVLFARWVEISNENIRASVDYDTGRFTLHTTEGDTVNTKDDNKALLYDNTPPTSVTTLSIDGEYQLFGNDNGYFKKRPLSDGKMITTEWGYQNILVLQEITLVKGLITGVEDTMQVIYKVQNIGNRKRQIGMRIILDTMLGDVEPKTFGIPGRGNVDKETILYRDSIPAFWSAMDIEDDPRVRSQCTLIGNNVTKPDKIIFSSWDRLYDNPWDVIIDSTMDFRKKGTGAYDSAAAMYYDPIEVNQGQSLIITMQYGVYGTSIFTAQDMLLSLSVPTEPKYPPVPVSVDFLNQSQSVMDRLELEIEVPRGFALKQGETPKVSFIKLETNSTVRALWNLYSGTIGGNFRVKVTATGFVGTNTETIDAEKTFYMNYIENMGLPVANPAAVKADLPVELKTNIESVPDIVDNPEKIKKTLSELSPIQKRIYRDVLLLDDWIGSINREYQILLGIYKNGILTNQAFLSETDRSIRKYEDRLERARATLTNQNIILRE